MSYFASLSEQAFAEQYPELAHEVAEKLGIGFVPALFRSLVELSPSLAHSTWSVLKTHLLEGDVPRVLKEMILIAVANSRQCDYCETAHFAICRHLGVDLSTLGLLVDDSDELRPELTRNILRLARRVTVSGHAVSEQDMLDLEAQGLERAEIIEIVGMIACSNYIVTIANSLNVRPDDRLVHMAQYGN